MSKSGAKSSKKSGKKPARKTEQGEAPAADAGKPPLVDPVQVLQEQGKSPELAALLAWVLPGAGHIYAGHRIKGLGALILVLGLFVWGVGISKGEVVSLHEEGGHEYAFLAQIGAGGPTLLTLAYTHGKLPGEPPERPDPMDPAYAARLPDLDTALLFTMIAGLLNLLLIHDALNGVPGAWSRRVEERRRQERLDAMRRELEGAEEAEGEDSEASAAAVDPTPPSVLQQTPLTGGALAMLLAVGWFAFNLKARGKISLAPVLLFGAGAVAFTRGLKQRPEAP